MAASLDQPSSEDPSEIYLIRGAAADWSRPPMTGDVFDGISVPGFDDGPGMAMVIGHPCSMRKGPELAPRLQVARVVPFEDLPPGRWPKSHFAKYPLSQMISDGSASFAADFEVVGMAPSEDVALDKRAICLSERGIHLLQQRLVHFQTRVVVPVTEFDAFLSPVLEEAELHDEWNIALAPLNAAFEDDRDAALLAEAHAFHDFMREGGTSSLQVTLREPNRRAAVRRRVMAEIEARKLAHDLGQLQGSDLSTDDQPAQ